MFAKIIADRYSRATLQSCPDLATIERVKDELNVLKDTWENYPDIRQFLLNPKIPPAIKTNMLKQSLSGMFSDLVIKLVELLIEKRRQDILPDIADSYTMMTDTVRGVEHATIIVAVPASEKTRQMLFDAVQRFSTRQVEVDFRVNPAILGGVQIRLGDKVVDGSLLKRFNDLRRTMLAARLPRFQAPEGSIS